MGKQFAIASTVFVVRVLVCKMWIIARYRTLQSKRAVTQAESEGTTVSHSCCEERVSRFVHPQLSGESRNVKNQSMLIRTRL